MSVTDLILDEIEDVLQAKMIDEIDEDDVARAGVVKQGYLQGEPDDDEARISITIHENDPDKFHRGSVTSMWGAWEDEIAEVEIGLSAIWNRRFTVKARCLLAETQENLAETRSISSTVRDRIVRALLGMNWAGIKDNEEYVSRGVLHRSMQAEAIQGGGPDSYDYHIKVRFEIQTTLSL